jgi:hypothetical protein
MPSCQSLDSFKPYLINIACKQIGCLNQTPQFEVFVFDVEFKPKKDKFGNMNSLTSMKTRWQTQLFQLLNKYFMDLHHDLHFALTN